MSPNESSSRCLTVIFSYVSWPLLRALEVLIFFSLYLTPKWHLIAYKAVMIPHFIHGNYARIITITDVETEGCAQDHGRCWIAEMESILEFYNCLLFFFPPHFTGSMRTIFCSLSPFSSKEGRFNTTLTDECRPKSECYTFLAMIKLRVPEYLASSTPYDWYFTCILYQLAIQRGYSTFPNQKRLTWNLQHSHKVRFRAMILKVWALDRVLGSKMCRYLSPTSYLQNPKLWARDLAFLCFHKPSICFWYMIKCWELLVYRDNSHGRWFHKVLLLL